MKKIPNVGDKAPEFALTDEKGAEHRLSAERKTGSVVLIFYPGDLTPGCTIQLCAVRDDWSAFRELGIKVFGVNHADADSHRAFSSAHGFPFPLLIDPKRAVTAKYGAREGLKPAKTVRTVVGISSDGIIRYRRVGLPKDTEILKAMKPFSKHE